MSKDEKRKIQKQKRAFPVEKELIQRREFSEREVGLTHPDLSSFIRLNDQGDVEIFAAPGVGIVISTRSKSISIFADSLRFFTKEDGLRWNNQNFNYSASTYVEPALTPMNPGHVHSAINGIQQFLNAISDIEAEETEKRVTIKPEYTFGSNKPTEPEQTYSNIDEYEGLTIDQIGLLEAYSTDYSQNQIKQIIKLLKEGYNFEQALEKAIEDVR